MKTVTDDFYELIGVEFQYQQILTLKKVLEESGISREVAKNVCANFTFNLGVLLDQGIIEVNQQAFRPVLTFLDADGSLYLPSDFFEYHEYAFGCVEEVFEKS